MKNRYSRLHESITPKRYSSRRRSRGNSGRFGGSSSDFEKSPRAGTCHQARWIARDRWRPRRPNGSLFRARQADSAVDGGWGRRRSKRLG